MSTDKITTLEQYGRGKILEPQAFLSIFTAPKKSSWKAMKQKKKKEPKKQFDDDGKHTGDKLTATAVIHKTGDWSGNFSYFIRSAEGKSRAKVYDNISNSFKLMFGPFYPLVVSFVNKNFKLTSVDCNFNKKSKFKLGPKTLYGNQKYPYNWEAHHMIPGDVFTQVRAGVKASKPIFKARQLRLLLLSQYDVNHGHNMIALPANNMDVFQPVHDMIQHPSDHPVYTKLVVKKVKKIAKDLDKMADDLDEPHPQVSVKIEEQLHALEDELWDLLIDLGKAAVASVIDAQKNKLSENQKNLIKSVTKEGTEYPLYALA